jgi:outer membrane protein OmpA-like peptidoglycan-associated protein
MFKNSALFAAGLILFLGACSSPKKAELKVDSPEEAMKTIKDLKHELIKDHVDVMAHREFKEGLEDYYRAKKQMQSKKDLEKVMLYLPQAKAHFMEAKTVADERTAKNKRVLKARTDALEAGAMESKNVKAMLEEVDKDLRSESKNFSRDVEVEEMSELQKKYLKVEARAVQYKELNTFRRMIFNAKNNDAKSLAPKSYRQALADLRTAENLIYQNPRNPRAYEAPVTELNKSSKLLDDIMNKLMGDAKGSSEAVAKQLVMQERKLGKLSSTVDNLKGNLSEKEKSLSEAQKNLNETAQNLESTKKSLEEQKSNYLSAKAQVKFQQAMDDVRKNFDSEEAEVYQQGKSLILRLKKLNFKSGSADIPETAIDLLTKISQVIKNIEPEKVQVQGHTDSVGNADYNQKLSSKRAESVQEFLDETDGSYATSSIGYGESKPLANNETSEGRALNRRVDIVVEAK